MIEVVYVEEQKDRLRVYKRAMADYAEIVKDIPYKDRKKILHKKFPELADCDLSFILNEF